MSLIRKSGEFLKHKSGNRLREVLWEYFTRNRERMEANYEAEVNPSESGPPAAREVSTGLVTGSGWVGGPPLNGGNLNVLPPKKKKTTTVKIIRKWNTLNPSMTLPFVRLSPFVLHFSREPSSFPISNCRPILLGKSLTRCPGRERIPARRIHEHIGGIETGRNEAKEAGG